MEFIKSLQDVISFQNIILAIGGLLSLFVTWRRLREGSIRLAQSKERDLRRLLENAKWEEVTPMCLQLALRQAFGLHIDERDFYFCQTRHDPLGLLLDRLGIKQSVSLNTDGTGYCDNRVLRKILSPRAEGWISFLLATVLLLPSIVFVLLAWKQNIVLGVVATVEALFIFFGLIQFSVHANTVRRVITLENHPPRQKSRAEESAAAKIEAREPGSATETVTAPVEKKSAVRKPRAPKPPSDAASRDSDPRPATPENPTPAPRSSPRPDGETLQ